MSARFSPAPLLALLAAAGCSLFCTFSGLQQPCDAQGDCLPGYECVANVCVGGGDGGEGSSSGGTGGSSSSGSSSGASGTGCTSDLSCPAGACVAGGCSALPTAWPSGGSAESASLAACFPPLPWPHQAALGLAAVPLSGCVGSYPGDTGTGLDAGGSLQVLEANNVVIVPATPLVADGKCVSGIGYKVMVPPSQLVDLVVTAAATGWTTTYNQAVELPADAGSGVRDIGVLSANGWAAKLGAAATALGVKATAQDSLEVGIVRDCGGNPMSGISIQTQPADGGFSVVYLDATGTPLTGRTATDSSGRFAAIAVASATPYTLIFVASTGNGTEELAALPLVVSDAGSSGWIDLAPLGP
jgi:hypothetical protein